VPRKVTTCSICLHEKRHQLEIGLTYHTPLRVLGQHFGVSKDAQNRHKRKQPAGQWSSFSVRSGVTATFEKQSTWHRAVNDRVLADRLGYPTKLQQLAKLEWQHQELRRSTTCSAACAIPRNYPLSG
jgi:hypothetical protein